MQNTRRDASYNPTPCKTQEETPHIIPLRAKQKKRRLIQSHSVQNTRRDASYNPTPCKTKEETSHPIPLRAKHKKRRLIKIFLPEKCKKRCLIKSHSMQNTRRDASYNPTPCKTQEEMSCHSIARALPRNCRKEDVTPAQWLTIAVSDSKYPEI